MNKRSVCKPVGTSIIFINAENEVLLILRDDIPEIRYPGMWDIPGGNLEKDETPQECIIREIDEEFGISITDCALFEVMDFPDRLEYTFWKRADFDIRKIHLTEGQRLEWFSEERAEMIQLAFGFNKTVTSFFEKHPFKS